jgi:hypothetical protein
MQRQALEQLMDKWINDSAFRTAIRQDLEGTVKRTGASLDAEDWEAIKKIDWNLSDEQLKARMNNFVI